MAAVFSAVSCGGGGGGISAAQGGNNAGKKGGIGGGNGNAVVYVNDVAVGGSANGDSSQTPENASATTYSSGIMALDWDTMDLKLWINGQLYLNQTIKKGDKLSIAGLKLGDSLRAEGTFITNDDGETHNISGSVPSVQDGSKLVMYVTYKYVCMDETGGIVDSGTYTAETGKALPAEQCLDGRTFAGWKNTITGVVMKNIAGGTTGNLTLEKFYNGDKKFNVVGTKITGFYGVYTPADGRVEIPYGITEIDSNAFANKSLTSVSLPATVTKIGDYAFYRNGFTSINLPAGLTELGEGAFNYCSTLQSITIPAGITEIPDNCFKNCNSLSSVSLPANLTTIGTSAFESCGYLGNLTVPASVTTIGGSAFASCKSPFYLTLLNEDPEINLGSGILDNINSYIIQVPYFIWYTSSSTWTAYAGSIQ